MHVYTLGETVLDIIFSDEKPVAATPGGAMLNTAVSLGRSGIPVNFISDFGEDRPGRIISEFLEKNGVSTRYVHRYSDGKTALALAFLDEKRDADYSFYKIFPATRLNQEFPETGAGDIVLFGSFYAITAGIRDTITKFIRRAQQSGALIIYDPNFRRPHLGELDRVLPWIRENISMADIVRGSDEDFSLIAGATDRVSAYRFVQESGCSKLIFTRNRQDVEIMTGKGHFSVGVPSINPVSTIGAGDAFNAGIIWWLVQNSVTREELRSLGEESWLEMARTGIEFSSEVCMHFDNYISPGG